MSIHHENLAWEIDLPALRKVVLLCLARFAHLTTRECRPSIRVIAFRCGMSESAARSCIDDLVEQRLIEKMKVPGKGTVYRIALGQEASA